LGLSRVYLLRSRGGRRHLRWEGPHVVVLLLLDRAHYVRVLRWQAKVGSVGRRYCREVVRSRLVRPGLAPLRLPRLLLLRSRTVVLMGIESCVGVPELRVWIRLESGHL